MLHNAGITAKRDLMSDDEPSISEEDEMTVNFIAPVELTSHLLGVLSQRGPDGAFVCFVTSGLALTPKRASPIYLVSKAALRSYTKLLRALLKATRPSVKVMEALPPAVATEMTAGLDKGDNMMSPEASAKSIVQGIDAGKLDNYIEKTYWFRWIDCPGNWRIHDNRQALND
ncbi:Short-chain dehydrogenase reductase sdr [Seminavis robusta]|uniref:Short-chain dehydrogenase reductase sdr n=1 Tax=Seminavis robusta TaxID=568900 RepID=A0A9N8EAY5_9STRA|nr:Short-chain dehydrogenase reductase sdr [Seminavis robusta]|eukprot:Sro904_g218410.1 Short-chain dehydrogenase reductase sdr (172) ;mRNA; r:29003-29518